MKRWLLKLGVLLLAGAIVNVVVAWACVFWSGPTRGGISAYAQDVQGESDLSIFRFDHPGKLHIKAMAGDLESEPYITPTSWAMSPGVVAGSLPARAPSPNSLVPPWARDELLPWGVTTAWPESDGYDSRTIVATGWPMRSVWASFDEVPNPVGYWGWKARAGVRLPDAWQPREVLVRGATPRTLGTQPIWRGFAVNTIVYAAVLWLVFAAPFALRRWRRIRRGRCPACAYPVGASETCTECGEPVGRQLAMGRKS